MKHYLLLRDNKQSGPHTIEELLDMGLRSYDLIWVDGKSAAWRYPAEFPELKAFAPAAPEQPFDRFFRKPEMEQAIAPSNTSTPALGGDGPDSSMDVPTLTRFMKEQEADKQKEMDRIRFEFPDKSTDQAAPKGEDDGDQPRYVSVSLPAQDGERPIVVIGNPESGEGAVSVIEQGNKEAQSDATDRLTPPGKPIAALFPERDPLAPSKKPAPRRSLPWVQYAAILVGILSFVGLGILIGVKWTREKMEAAESQRLASLQADRSNTSPATTEQRSLVSPSTDTIVTAKTLPLDNKFGRRQKKDSNGNQPLVSGDLVHADVTKEMDPSVLQEEARKRREAEEKERTKGNITQVVGLQPGKYKVGVFGGVSDFDVTISNGSGYPMDLVVVEVDYLLSSDKVYKTETLRFTDLGPHGIKTLTLPRTGRGVKAESRIVRIDSRELDLAWSRN